MADSAFAVVYHAEIVHVAFGGKYVEYSALLPVILAFATLNTFATPVSLVAQYEEKTEIQLLSKIFAGYNVVAMLVLIPRMACTVRRWRAVPRKHSRCVRLVARAAACRMEQRMASTVSSVILWGATVGVCFAVKHLIAAPRWCS